METIINAGRLVTPTSIDPGHVAIRDGIFTSVERGVSRHNTALDWEEDLLIPGLIDIHTDNLEKHYMPRAGAHWDSYGAVLAHDGQMATAGITTVFDSLSLHGKSNNGLDRAQTLSDMIGAVDRVHNNAALRINHLLHLRCEVSNKHLMSSLEPYLDHKRLTMLSLMDHTPGARYPGGVEALQKKWRGRGLSEDDISLRLSRGSDWRDSEGAFHRRRDVADLGARLNIPVASHDDGLPEHIDEAKSMGCSIAEFPLTLDAAARAQEVGLVNVMGAPNFVRGSSHGGNASARDLAQADYLDILCSDYVPHSMIRAAFLLTEEPFGWSLQKAIGTVSTAPARVSGLDDRGSIVEGQRADFLRVSWRPGSWPLIKEVWCGARRVA